MKTVVAEQEKQSKMKMSKENQLSFTAKKVKNAAPPKGSVLFHLLVVLMGAMAISVASGKFLQENSMAEDNLMAMFVLGDSSVDCGDNTLFYPLLHHNLSLYPCDGSDTTLLPLLLAKRMGLPNIQPFYSQNGSIEGLLKGVNFGSAQATIMNPSSQGHQSLNQQLRQVFETLQDLQLQLSKNRADYFIKSSIIYLSFGKDDYIDLFLRNSSGMMLKYSSQEFARILVDQMVHAMSNLYNANVRKIICMGILPLGCTPRTLWEWSNATSGGDDRRGCVKEINELVLEYNTLLDESIVELNSNLPDAQIVFCDVYQGIMEIVTHPRRYGFENVTSACCGVGLYGATIGCLSREMACDQASNHVWWDLYNPTEAINNLLRDSAWSGHPFSGTCRPITIEELVNNS